MMQEFFTRNLYLVLSTVDSRGNPWGAPVFFVHDEENTLYWWSDTESQHSRNIDLNGKVFINIFDSTAPEGEASGLYLRCSAQRVPGKRVEKIRALYNQKAKTFQLDEASVSGDAPMRLYQAIPEQIWHNAEGSRNGKYVDIRKEIV